GGTATVSRVQNASIRPALARYVQSSPSSSPSSPLLARHYNKELSTVSFQSFICEICGKAFRFRSNLAEHRSVHTALKPYVCKYCGKSSRLKGNLTKHILKHHKKEQNEQIGKDDIIIKKQLFVICFGHSIVAAHDVTPSKRSRFLEYFLSAFESVFVTSCSQYPPCFFEFMR
ncbi:unnamed protein product, partial [Heligmosomoides polygyrus]|uniref:C2H2-type domain-containing protein n=1 Tax=Heligmosomoides polygyrus TaxID=6339 RepID=A0A183G7S4_HELPZ